MRKLVPLLTVFILFFYGCKDDCECETCGFHQPDHPVEPQPLMPCADSCFITYELFGKQYSYSNTDIYSVQLVKCKQDDSCSHVLNSYEVEESFKLAMQRFEDSLQFTQSFNKKLPLFLYDSLLWGQKVGTATFELKDNCGNAHLITNNAFPENNYIVYDTAIFMDEQVDSISRIYFYTIKGSFNAEILVEQYTNTVSGVYDINGQFSLYTALVLLD